MAPSKFGIPLSLPPVSACISGRSVRVLGVGGWLVKKIKINKQIFVPSSEQQKKTF